jgi:hypothetical protein
MAKTHIVNLKRVEDGLILYGEWSGAPGCSGQCGLAVTRRKSGFQLWSWDNEYGLQRRVTVNSISFRAVIDLLIADEAFRAAVDSWTVEIVNDREGWGELVAMAWEDDELTQKRLSLLLTLTDDSLLEISGVLGLRSTLITKLLDGVLADAEEMEVELADLPRAVMNGGKTLSSLRKGLANVVDQAVEEGRRHQQQQIHEQRRISLYKQITNRYCTIWSRTNPPTRGGTMTIPRVGYWSLYRYILNFLGTHGFAPHGQHQVPGGVEDFNRQANNAVLDLDPYFHEVLANFHHSLPPALRDSCRDIVTRHRLSTPQAESLLNFCEWLETDGYDALERASGEVMGVAIADISKDQFCDRNLRDWEGLTSRKRVSNSQRLAFMRERLTEQGDGGLGESPFPSIFKFPLIDAEGFAVLIGGYATIHGQAGPEFMWLGVFGTESDFYDALGQKGIVADADIQYFTDSELLALWKRL